VKSPKEIALQKYAATVSAQAHIELMKFCRPGVYEFQLESKFIHYCSMHGLRLQGYPSIVGSGYNSAVLHYSKNSKIVADGDLVLVDAGGEILNYTADITRTFPANGKFNDKQRLIYGKVLAIQKELISMIKPGVLFQDIIARSGYLVCMTALNLGLVQGSEDDIPTMVAARVQYAFMPHGLGHFLGQDVHDTSIYPKEPLQPGNVVTIEPGIYFNESAIQSAMETVDKRPWLNMPAIQPWIDSNFGGVRIEDDVLVTADGYEVLSASSPKEIEEIEAIMSR
jgi:Xaa-Pro aminopeptidase